MRVVGIATDDDRGTVNRPTELPRPLTDRGPANGVDADPPHDEFSGAGANFLHRQSAGAPTATPGGATKVMGTVVATTARLLVL